MRRELDGIQKDLDHVANDALRLRHESVAKEDEIDARWKSEENEGERDDDQQRRELPVPFEALARHRCRGRFVLGSAAGPHSDEDDVRVAEAHEGERAEIVENEMNALPLRVDIGRIVTSGIAHDQAGFRSVAVEKENMAVHSQADTGEGEKVVLGVSDFAVGLFPRLPVEAERAI